MKIGGSSILTFNIGMIHMSYEWKQIKIHYSHSIKSPSLPLLFLNECIFIFHITTEEPGQHVQSKPQIHQTYVQWPMLICKLVHTFLLGECITGAGGDGGPLGIFLFVLDVQKIIISFNPHCNSLYSVTHCVNLIGYEFKINWGHHLAFPPYETALRIFKRLEAKHVMPEVYF